MKKEEFLKTLEGLSLTHGDEYGNEFIGGYEEGVDEAYILAKELDEPKITQEQAWEVLAPRFNMEPKQLEESVVHGFLAMTAEEIEMESDKIRKLADGIKKLHAENETLKAKQEKVKVPQFVAEYIQEGKELGCDLGTAMTVQTEMLKDIRDYIKNNEELFARAWLDGYEIEKEKLYYVLNKKGFLMMRKYEGEIDTMRISNTLSIDGIGDASNYLLTEKEIKDYDERYWAFAQPVEETE